MQEGYRIDWIGDGVRLFEDITRRVGEIRAEAKARDPPDMVLDKLVKEIGNSIYGKVAQAVASTDGFPGSNATSRGVAADPSSIPAAQTSRADLRSDS